MELMLMIEPRWRCFIEGGVAWGEKTCRRDSPRDGAHVDDRATLALFHRGCDGLGDEELMFEVDCHAAIPQVGGDIFPRVADVVAGVIYQHIDRLEAGED